VRRYALITGGASGIGLAAAKRLAAGGVDVITADVAAGADIVLDVTDADAAVTAVEALGQIDILVNCAGLSGHGEDVFAVTLHGSVNMCRAVIPGMLDRGWGRVVNVASVEGASKSAVIGFTASLGRELASAGVVVNAIAHGVIDEVAELIAWLTSESCVSGGLATS
jgi:NAD(P)-dependent dehydrogenase (short-subunit alcohol dehydrogenase family)